MESLTRSRTEIYIHAVWSTHRRQPFITCDLERAVHRIMREQVEHLGASVVAIGGMPDHVHMLVRMPAKIDLSHLVQQVKGVSSFEIRRNLPMSKTFRWQSGFGAFSVSRSHVKRVADYLHAQPERHHTGTTWPEWEETSEPSQPLPADRAVREDARPTPSASEFSHSPPSHPLPADRAVREDARPKALSE
jgi:REP element-mobilizing transposase RayT